MVFLPAGSHDFHPGRVGFWTVCDFTSLAVCPSVSLSLQSALGSSAGVWSFRARLRILLRLESQRE